MEAREKDLIKLRFALALWRRLEYNKGQAAGQLQHGKSRSETVDSYQKLERASGIPKATIIRIFQGRINAASTTLWALAEALDGGMTALAKEIDQITEEDLVAYRETIRRNQRIRLERKKKASTGPKSRRATARKQ